VLKGRCACNAVAYEVLDEFVAVAGCHRKHAIRLLTMPHPAAPGTLRVARQIYGQAVREALVGHTFVSPDLTSSS